MRMFMGVYRNEVNNDAGIKASKNRYYENMCLFTY